MSGLVSLSGDWVLRKKGSDYLPELEDHDGIPPVSKLIDSTTVFRIIQVATVYDEVIQNGIDELQNVIHSSLVIA